MVRSADLPLTVPSHPTSVGPSARDPPYSTPPRTGWVGGDFNACLIKSHLSVALFLLKGPVGLQVSRPHLDTAGPVILCGRGLSCALEKVQ